MKITFLKLKGNYSFVKWLNGKYLCSEQGCNLLNLIITRMGLDSRGRSKQERSGVVRTKKSMWLNIKQNRKTKQTIHSKKSMDNIGTCRSKEAAEINWERVNESLLLVKVVLRLINFLPRRNVVNKLTHKQKIYSYGKLLSLLPWNPN